MNKETMLGIEQEITQWLRSVALNIDPPLADYDDLRDDAPAGWCDVRIYLSKDDSGAWSWRGCWGDASYDQDHRGFCGAGAVAHYYDPGDCQRAAVSLVADALELVADSEGD